MTAALVVLLIGLAGLALVAWLLAREPVARIRIATVAGATGGFLLALLAGFAFLDTALAALATATLGAAVLSLALLGQWRLIRSLFARQGREL